MYMVARGVDFAPFYDLSIDLWKCSDSVYIFLFSILLLLNIYFSGRLGIVCTMNLELSAS